jgi:hypothetical protein
MSENDSDVYDQGGRRPRALRRGKKLYQTRENENAVTDTESGTRDIRVCRRRLRPGPVARRPEQETEKDTAMEAGSETALRAEMGNTTRVAGGHERVGREMRADEEIGAVARWATVAIRADSSSARALRLWALGFGPLRSRKWGLRLSENQASRWVQLLSCLLRQLYSVSE